MRILICDDEPLALSRLGSLLSRTGRTEGILEATSGRDAIDLAVHSHPDLMLIDVEMPVLDGFDVVDAVGRLSEHPPLIAFVTAYRRFAPQAFDTGAIDFLTKPVRLARLEDTLARAERAIEGREAARRIRELQEALSSLRAAPDPHRDAHLWVPRRGEVVRVNLDDIERVEAEGAYVRLSTPIGSLLHREAIGALEARLDPERFVRVHRSHIVRTDQISAIRRTPHGSSELVLGQGERVPIGRKYASVARSRLLGCRDAVERDG